LEPETAPRRILGCAAAGGSSLRMGRDKALLSWGESTLLGHALATLRAAFGNACILSGAEARYGGFGMTQVVDEPAGAGPLGGLAAALRGARRDGYDAVFLLAVDLPFVPPELAAHVAASLAGGGVAAPHTPRGPEPLCAAYSTGCLAAVERSLERGHLKMTSFWPGVACRLVEEPELRRFGDPRLVFANVNSPADYARAKTLSRP
jgi:molybdopterin-guanine dinucleotide biosynthesis protein A